MSCFLDLQGINWQLKIKVRIIVAKQKVVGLTNILKDRYTSNILRCKMIKSGQYCCMGQKLGYSRKRIK